MVGLGWFGWFLISWWLAGEGYRPWHASRHATYRRIAPETGGVFAGSGGRLLLVVPQTAIKVNRRILVVPWHKIGRSLRLSSVGLDRFDWRDSFAAARRLGE